MGHGIHTYFKPTKSFASEEELYQHCKQHLSCYNLELMDDFISLDPWCFILDFPMTGSGFYLRLYTQGRIGKLRDEPECRRDIKVICESFGATDWWTCDENSDDYICDLTYPEFEEFLKKSSNEYEDFANPNPGIYQPRHFIHDSSDKQF